jgi:hypothetical protein
LSEWKPFVTAEMAKQNEKPYSVAIEKNINNEKVHIWPYDHKNQNYYVAIYAKTLMPFNFKPTGFLCLTKSGAIVKDKAVCQRIAQDFTVWQKLYLHPPFKYVPKAYFELLRKLANLSLDNCKKRQEKQEYDLDNPSKKGYNEVLIKLDNDVIKNNKLILANIANTEQLILMEKTLWQRCSYEKMDKLRRILLNQKELYLKMSQYCKKRGNLFFEYEKAIKDAYKIDLQVTRYSIAEKAAISFFLWLANAGLIGLAIPYLPDALKLVYQELAGHKALLKKSKSYLRKAKKLAELAEIYSAPVDVKLVRN